MSDSESDYEDLSDNEDDVIIVKGVKNPEIKCLECGKRLRNLQVKGQEQYHKKCYKDYTNRIIFFEKLKNFQIKPLSHKTIRDKLSE